MIWWPSIKISTTTFFSNKISVQLLLISNCLEERIEDLCKLSFFLHPIQKLLQESFGFLDCSNPKEIRRLSRSLKKQQHIYYLFLATERPELDNYYTIVCDPYFFSFLGFFFIYYYHIFGFFLNLSQLSIDRTIWFPKKENFCNTIYWVLNSQFCSLPHQALKWYSLNFSHNPIFFLMISQNWSLCDCCKKILSEFSGLAICGVTSKNCKQTAACSIEKATTLSLTC